MAIDPNEVKRLRDATGAGMMDCKRALEQAAGDFDRAKVILREQGKADAQKYSTRSAGEGVVDAYLHAPDPSLPAKVGTLVELNCATDFVAKTERFRDLAHAIAMHIAARPPAYVSRDDVPAEVIEAEREIYRKQVEGKPPNVVEKIVDGKLEKFFEQVCLLDQPYIRDEDKTVGQLIEEASSELKEPVKIRRFARFRVGGE